MKKQSIFAYALKNAIEHSGKATAGPVINSLFNEGLKKDKIKDTMPAIQKVLDEVNKLSPEEQQKEFKKLESIIGYRKEREGLPDLPKLKKGKVVTRFGPSPSGPLTISIFVGSSSHKSAMEYPLFSTILSELSLYNPFGNANTDGDVPVSSRILCRLYEISISSNSDSLTCDKFL